LDGAQWGERVRRASAIGEAYALPDVSADDDEQARRWLASIDKTAYVGSRHHTVPRFLLERWADKNGQVQVYHRIEARLAVENIRDLAIKDFYTVIDNDGEKNSALESLLGVVEGNTKPIVEAILNPFVVPTPLHTPELAQLALFASFQGVRTARHRREIELRAEWYAKTMAQGRISDSELRQYTIVPHQNESIVLTSKSAENLLPFFVCRPLAIVNLDSPLLVTCDEPVVLNAPVGAVHVEDCYLTDEQIQARMDRPRRKGKKRKRRRARTAGRVVHFSSTAPSGYGTADEILIALSPSVALLWGPLGDQPDKGPAERISLRDAEAQRFATMANDAMCAQALDWIVSRIGDESFATRTFPTPGPLMKVCDGTNAASIAINETPTRFRPHRLWTSDEPVPAQPSP
jgi:hypothetical protein